MTNPADGRLMRWLIIAIVLHNCEEVWALSLYPDAPRDALALTGLSLEIPPLDTLRAGLAAFALIPAFVLWRAMKTPSPRLVFLTCMIAAMTASNAVVPHILLGGASGGYTPGLLTAITLTLPVGLVTLVHARRERWLPVSQHFAAIVLGIALLPLVLGGFLALGELIAELAR